VPIFSLIYDCCDIFAACRLRRHPRRLIGRAPLQAAAFKPPAGLADLRGADGFTGEDSSLKACLTDCDIFGNDNSNSAIQLSRR
jgi:hypothetical protein